MARTGEQKLQFDLSERLMMIVELVKLLKLMKL